ncbi:hypothetical protein [Prauserella endophytica]|uniref:Uncharacterized protein n=1 Tax=Prauserella endophytica TaxID=1592324 RepID=A0ABY2RV03_9PSEU|nr:hypothetical protein [Prauserella endophytica]TKG61536.1 hypothetical protein FCN18_33395 [Prauserella endophytica]
MTSTSTTAQLLYLEVDFGDRPALATLRTGVLAVERLAALAYDLHDPPPHSADEPWPWRRRITVPHSSSRNTPEGVNTWVQPVVIERTSLASPWVTVLAEAAKSAQPLYYTCGTLLVLHRLLNMTMSWQRHRMDMRERQEQMGSPPRGVRGEEGLVDDEAPVFRAVRETTPQMPESEMTPYTERWPGLDEMPPTPEMVATKRLQRQGRKLLRSDLVDHEGVSRRELEKGVVELQRSVERAAKILGQIQANEMIAEDDPRATG